MTNAAPLRTHLPQPSESNILSVMTAKKKAKKKPVSSKIALPCMEGLVFEKTKHILYLEAEGNYTTIHFDDKRTLLVCKTLRELEEVLPAKKFVRIHRSHTVHLKFVAKYIKGKSGYVVLTNKKTLGVSLGQKDAFLEALSAYFAM
jgi:two-component system, LytTR family, response regulator